MPISKKVTGEGREVLRGGMVLFPLLFVTTPEEEAAQPDVENTEIQVKQTLNDLLLKTIQIHNQVYLYSLTLTFE